MRTNLNKHRTQTQKKINIITLGCSKNLVDSENLLTQLHHQGLAVSHENYQDSSDIVVINTCGFIDQAKEESVNTILDYVGQKEEGGIEQVIVTGCLSERYKDDLKNEIPEVDAWFGTQDMPDLVQHLGADYKQELLGERKTSTDSHFAYLKIAEGCNRPCSFCAIPLMRGKHRSRSIEMLVNEAKFLVRKGVKEIMLIAQDLTYYGIDLYGKRKLNDLLKALSDVEGLRWIRLHYAYPSGFPLDILPTIRERNNICNYLDMPLQHIADPVLKSMRRGINEQRTRNLIDTIRQEVPDIALRTTLLVGHPGETEEAHQALLGFVQDIKFDRLGVFTYSHEENTHAGDQLVDEIPAEVKEARMEEVMEIQQDISLEINRKRIGQNLWSIIDRKENDYFVGRTEYDSPEVDNEVIIRSEEELEPGTFYPVKITDALEYDLIGHVLKDPDDSYL
ncbi:MAG: 30S ribosomal protein S12 methylthiotransferase RimO [Bacteroidota bacterium]